MRAIHKVVTRAAVISLTLAGCSSGFISEQAPAVADPPISAATWRDVDEEIWSASRLATGEAETYARSAMGEWMGKVRQRTEEEFVPWYLDYWTQQWVSVKVAWYELSEEEGDPVAAERLAAYLQEEFESRVLRPVAEEVDPREIRDTASALYLDLLSEKLQTLPEDFAIPAEAFRARLAAVPVIEISGDPERRADLATLVYGENVTAIPAYAALVQQIETRGGDSTDELQTVAKIAADKLAGTMAVRGGAAAAAAAVGGPIGVVISVGAFGWGAYAHERDKPALEARLRDALDSALQEIWGYTVEDSRTGVTAPLRHMSARIEQGVSVPYAESIRANGGG